MVLCDADAEEVVGQARLQAEHLHQIVVQPVAQQEGHLSWEDVLDPDSSAPDVEVLNTDDAEILYTSDTTGMPKGALFDHQRVLHASTSFALGVGIGSNDRLLHLVPLYHSAQLNLFLVTGILLGTTNVILRECEPTSVMKTIDEFSVTVYFGLPEMYSDLLAAQRNDKLDLSSVRKCFYDEEPMETELVEKAMAFFGGAEFYNLCFVTEGGPGGVFLKPEDHDLKIGKGGKAMLFTQVRIVDDEFHDMEPGKVGEFIIKSDSIMKEYFRMPEETEEAFSEGWLLTGELAMIDEDGFVSLIDRKQDRIISAGENIYSVEVERVINKHPKVEEAATVGLPEEEWGEIVGVVIVPKKGETLEEKELMTYFLEHLEDRKIPKKYLFANELPRNTSGKILKYKLRDLHVSEFFWFKQVPAK